MGTHALTNWGQKERCSNIQCHWRNGYTMPQSHDTRCRVCKKGKGMMVYNYKKWQSLPDAIPIVFTSKSTGSTNRDAWSVGDEGEIIAWKFTGRCKTNKCNINKPCDHKKARVKVTTSSLNKIPEGHKFETTLAFTKGLTDYKS